MNLQASTASAAFSVFGVDAVLNGDDVRVMLDKGVQVEDSDGSITRVDYLVHARRSAFAWSRGDTLTVSGIDYRLGNLVNDDGEVVQVSAMKS